MHLPLRAMFCVLHIHPPRHDLVGSAPGNRSEQNYLQYVYVYVYVYVCVCVYVYVYVCAYVCIYIYICYVCGKKHTTW